MSNFIDQATVYVAAGKGGDGIVAFRREKYVPDGGPAGGNGGRGGDVIFKVDEGMNSLMHLRYNPHYKADKGENGMGKSMHGRGAEDLYVMVPAGTVVKDKETGQVIGDLTEEGEELLVAKGGRGGRGNQAFKSQRNKAPEIAENGEPGQERTLLLELKLLADVGLVGFPSVGKSTLLSVISAAKPKIGDYPFTTLVPNLGVVETKDHRTFVVADIPGLIEGASEGVGLGTDFLRHIERTRLIVHMLDMSRSDGRDPFEDYQVINHELSHYERDLSQLPQILVANKMEMPEAEDNLELFKEEYQEVYGEEAKVLEISAHTQKGLDRLIQVLADRLEEIPRQPLYEETSDQVVYSLEEEPAFKLERDPEGVWLISGPEFEKLVEMTNFDHDESIKRFTRQMRQMGVEDALLEAGAKNGDLVDVGLFTFEYVD